MINKISLVRAGNVQYEYYATLKDESLFGDRPSFNLDNSGNNP